MNLRGYIHIKYFDINYKNSLHRNSIFCDVFTNNVLSWNLLFANLSEEMYPVDSNIFDYYFFSKCFASFYREMFAFFL